MTTATFDLSPLRKPTSPAEERQRMLTVRLSPELHQRTAAACNEERISMNGLCVGLLEHWLASRAQPPAAEQAEGN